MERLTKQQAAIIGAYTGIVAGPFSDLHEYAEKIMGRHERDKGQAPMVMTGVTRLQPFCDLYKRLKKRAEVNVSRGKSND